MKEHSPPTQGPDLEVAHAIFFHIPLTRMYLHSQSYLEKRSEAIITPIPLSSCLFLFYLWKWLDKNLESFHNEIE
jgi:hypothetical protein